MQWLLLTGWILWIRRTACRNRTVLRLALSAGLLLAMGTQLLLLHLDRLLTWREMLPLHLCSLFGILSSVLLWQSPAWWREAVCYLGAPGAFFTLFFPAQAYCSHPLLMSAAFGQLHVLLALMPCYLFHTGKPLPTNPRRTLLMGNGYLLFICLINRWFSTNYLFLRSAPLGTPLMLLYACGPAFYLCALEMLCLLIFSQLRYFYAHFKK